MDAETKLQRAWFDAEGLETAPDERIHPDDDMARAEVLGTEPDRRRAVYMRSGHEARCVLKNALVHAGRELSALPSLLDFAGGYGRVVRFLASELTPRRIWVSDVLHPAVDFARETFGVSGFYSATDPADLRPPRSFSVIWVASLFTHLPRERFGTFLATLFSALEPDGLLLFSTHSPKNLPAADRDPSGFTFKEESESRILDPGEYGTTFVEPAVVRSICGEVGIDHVWGLEQELWRIQDVYAVSPKALEGMDSWTHAPVVRGSISKAEYREDGSAWVGGWTRAPRAQAPVESVTLLVDGDRRIETHLAQHASELEPEHGGPWFHQTDWYVEGPAADLGSGEHTICAVAAAKGGGKSCFDAAHLRIP